MGRYRKQSDEHDALTRRIYLTKAELFALPGQIGAVIAELVLDEAHAAHSRPAKRAPPRKVKDSRGVKKRR